ncbi:MAG: 50S ribosomal protein L15 [Alphaproteobacteria bacterium]
MKLNQISDNPGAHRRSKRLGRGIGSGKGKTAGKGHKGQSARSGVRLGGFEGGQMPLTRRLPKRGFHNPFRPRYQVINLATLESAIGSGRLDAAKTVTAALLKELGVIRRERDGIRLLGKGTISTAVAIEVAGASKSAVAAVEKAGGRVILTKAPEDSGAGKPGARKRARPGAEAPAGGQG